MIVDVIAQISDLLDLGGYLISRDFGAWKDLNVFRPREKSYLFAAAKRTALFAVEENPRAARTEFDPAAAMVFRDHTLEAYRPPQKLGNERRRRLFVNLRRTADLPAPAPANARRAARQWNRRRLGVGGANNR